MSRTSAAFINIVLTQVEDITRFQVVFEHNTSAVIDAALRNMLATPRILSHAERLKLAAADVVASIGNEEHQDAAKTNFRRLANDLRQLLLTFGIDSAIAKRREIEALGACTESRPSR
jgi:hypothetical protein